MSNHPLVINDPIHGVMEFLDSDKQSIRSIINHPLFQRLRHIKQLGMGDLVFPGAVHTRFNHSLGAAYLANRILERILSEDKKREWQWIVTIVALLHDVGHGPFSHAFERLTQEENLTKITHEDWTSYFLEEILGTEEPGIFKMVLSLITKTEPLHAELQFMSDLISSQLDADRLDYLLRDSHFCGVSYGKYDLNWLLQCMVAIPDNENKLRLGISLKGVGAVESFLMARRLMTQNVYYHPMIHLLQSLTMVFLAECCTHIQETSLQTLCPMSLKEFLEGLSRYRTKEISKHQFMMSYFDSYKRLTDHMVYQWIERVVSNSKTLPHSIINLGERLYYRKVPKTFRLRRGQEVMISNAIEMLREKHGYAFWQVGLEGGKFVTYGNSKEKILVKDKEPIEITQLSLFVDSLVNQQESLYYLYVDIDLLSEKPIKELIKSLDFN